MCTSFNTTGRHSLCLPISSDLGNLLPLSIRLPYWSLLQRYSRVLGSSNGVCANTGQCKVKDKLSPQPFPCLALFPPSPINKVKSISKVKDKLYPQPFPCLALFPPSPINGFQVSDQTLLIIYIVIIRLSLQSLPIQYAKV